MSRGDKSKQKTCHAIDACSQDQIIDIFEESFGYLSFVSKFVNRIKQSPIDYDKDIIASSSKPLIILDIDNTILFVRFFSDEICVNDHITYYHNGIDETSGIVRAVWYRLKLELSDDDLIDEYGTDMIEYDHCHTFPSRLKKKKNFEYPYKINELTNEIIDSRETLITQLTVIGCEIEYKLIGNDINEPFFKYISFEEDSIEIENFLPSLKRKGYKDAAFVYDGFIVRIRPGCEDFLDTLEQNWDIVFFTAANRSIYDGLMKELHSYLCLNMGRDEDNDDPIWKKIFFRDDCTYDFDERGKIYHHKDLTKYNRDLSKVIIVDNSSLSYKSEEPNAIAIKDFFGKDTIDNELEIVLELTDRIIDCELEYENNTNIYIDYRYILTNIINPNNTNQINKFEQLNLNKYNRRNPNDILLSTKQFLNDLKESLIQNGKLPTNLNFGEPKHDNDITDVIAVANGAGDESLINDQIDKKSSSAQSLQSSITAEINENEGTATPKGNYTSSVNKFPPKNVSFEQKENDNETEDIDIKMDDKNKNRTKKREHSYNISINFKDIPSFSNESNSSNNNRHHSNNTTLGHLGVIMQDPELRDKFSDMNEREMRDNIDNNNNFDDLESVSSDNNGIGSRMDDTDDDTDNTNNDNNNNNNNDSSDSDWDDIDDDNDNEEKKTEQIEEIKQPEPQIEEIELVVKAPPTRHMRLQTPNRTRKSTMKPRPSHDKIASGMSSVFLKRSVFRLRQLHEQTARRSSLTRASIDYHHEEPIIGSTQGVGPLKDNFEQKIDHQQRVVRRDSLRGSEAKEELERTIRMQKQSSIDKEQIFELKIGSPTYNYKTEKPKPKKLIKRIDNPWVAKFRKQGIKQPQQLARVMNTENKKQPRRKKENNNVIVKITKRELPPAPIGKRKLPPAPKKVSSNFNSGTLMQIKANRQKNMHITKNNMNTQKQQQRPSQPYSLNKLQFNMDGGTMSFSYMPATGKQTQQNIVVENKEEKIDDVTDMPSLETIFNKKKGDTKQYIGDMEDDDSEDSLLDKMEQAPIDQ